MNILLSGGTGLVGTELGKALVAKGHKIYLLTRNTEKSKTYTPFPHVPVYWDAVKNSPPSDIVSEIDAVINLAGVNISEKRWSDSFKNKVFNSRVVGTQNLARAINDHGGKVKTFISTSATGYYGDTGKTPVTEDANPAYDFLGKLCVAWESPIENLLNESIRRVIIRVGVVMSEKGGALAKMIPPIQSGIGGALGSGKQLMSWIDVDDLVQTYIFALENEKMTGTYNAVAPECITNRQLTELVAKRFNRRPGPSVPGFALRIAVGEMAKVLLADSAVSSQKLKDAGFKFKYGNINDSIEKRIPTLRGSEQRRIYQQWVPKDRSQLFDFFSDAKNLETLTPPFLNFKILSMSSEQVEEGTILKYQIKLNGIPMTWVTRIAEWKPIERFADNQENGPYKRWYHIHEFSDLANGTLMFDQVDSIVPMGTFGLYTAGHKVYNDVEKIFAFRRKKIAELYGNAAIK